MIRSAPHYASAIFVCLKQEDAEGIFLFCTLDQTTLFIKEKHISAQMKNMV